jgi:hypothetical protein
MGIGSGLPVPCDMLGSVSRTVYVLVLLFLVEPVGILSVCLGWWVLRDPQRAQRVLVGFYARHPFIDALTVYSHYIRTTKRYWVFRLWGAMAMFVGAVWSIGAAVTLISGGWKAFP